MRQGQGLINYAMGDKIRGVFYKAQPHGQCVHIYTDGFERGGVWLLRVRRYYWLCGRHATVRAAVYNRRTTTTRCARKNSLTTRVLANMCIFPLQARPGKKFH
jgi:hypothetical protein